jgi:hypothetical protein
MDLEARINSFAILGEILRNALKGNFDKYLDYSGKGSDTSLFDSCIGNQYLNNPWFTPENVRFALTAIADELTRENLVKWTNSYPQLWENRKPLKAGVIMAGNIPLAGFHDFLSVLISGNNLIAKTSTKDSGLIVLLGDILCSINPGFRNKISFSSDVLTDFDLVIATGSNNSSRYFEYYFGKYSNIIRKNRNSIALIDGNESSSELEALGTDIFSYFGLGCRNVSKIFIPAGYNLRMLTDHWSSFSGCIRHEKYANNYDFNKAVYIVNKESFHDTGFLLLKEEKNLSSPVSVLYYEYYKSQYAVQQQIEGLKDKIQCIAGTHNTPFGKTQLPHLWDYADGIDTLEFLLKKSLAGIL